MEDYPEYLALFSNRGECIVRVDFRNKETCVADVSMHPSEIEKIIDHTTGKFFRKMYFDDHLHEIHKYEVDLSKNSLTIKAS